MTLWRDFSATPLEFLNSIETAEWPPHSPPSLGLHSMWDTGRASIVEILGIAHETEEICVRVWVPIGPAGTGWVKIAAGCPSRGAGTNVTVKYTDLFPDDTAVRVVTHPDELVRVGNKKEVARRILHTATTARPTLTVRPHPTVSDKANQLAQLMEGRSYTAFTDGSYSELPTASEYIFSERPQRTIHGASLVLVPEGGDHPPIVLHLSHDDNLGADCAFPMELIPFVLAL